MRNPTPCLRELRAPGFRTVQIAAPSLCIRVRYSSISSTSARNASTEPWSGFKPGYFNQLPDSSEKPNLACAPLFAARIVINRGPDHLIDSHLFDAIRARRSSGILLST